MSRPAKRRHTGSSSAEETRKWVSASCSADQEENWLDPDRGRAKWLDYAVPWRHSRVEHETRTVLINRAGYVRNLEAISTQTGNWARDLTKATVQNLSPPPLPPVSMLAQLALLTSRLGSRIIRNGSRRVSHASSWTTSHVRSYTTPPSNPTSTATVNKHPVQATVCWVRAYLVLSSLLRMPRAIADFWRSRFQTQRRVGLNFGIAA